MDGTSTEKEEWPLIALPRWERLSSTGKRPNVLKKSRYRREEGDGVGLKLHGMSDAAVHWEGCVSVHGRKN